MAITPNDILNKEFDKKFRGYSQDQVNEFLDLVVVDFERAFDEARQLKQQLAAAQEKIQHFEKLQESLNSSILVANEAAERLKQNARKEAELIIYEAERESDRIIGNAQETMNHLTTEVDLLRHNARNLQLDIERMLTQQLEYVKAQAFEAHLDEAQVSTEDVTHRSLDKVAELEERTKAQELVAAVEELYDTMVLDKEELAAAAENQQQATESILGQTIQIELPEDK